MSPLDLRLDLNARRAVPQDDASEPLVPVLSPRALALGDALLKVPMVKLNNLRFGQVSLKSGDGDGAGVNAPFTLSRRDALPAVAA